MICEYLDAKVTCSVHGCTFYAVEAKNNIVSVGCLDFSKLSKYHLPLRTPNTLYFLKYHSRGVSNVFFCISKTKYYDIDLECILEMHFDFSSEKYSGGKGKTVVWYHGMCGMRLVGKA